MGNVNARQSGLVSLLELFTDGRVPDELSGILQAGIDVRPFIELGKRQRIQAAAVAAGTAAGGWSFPELAVPQSEAWLAVAYSVDAVIPLGLAASIQPAVLMPAGPANQSFAIGDPQKNTNTALASRLFAFADVLPIIAPPGSVFGGITQELSAATAFNATGVLDFVRIKL